MYWSWNGIQIKTNLGIGLSQKETSRHVLVLVLMEIRNQDKSCSWSQTRWVFSQNSGILIFTYEGYWFKLVLYLSFSENLIHIAYSLLWCKMLVTSFKGRYSHYLLRLKVKLLFLQTLLSKGSLQKKKGFPKCLFVLRG